MLERNERSGTSWSMMENIKFDLRKKLKEMILVEVRKMKK